jgi:mevalonate kinase
MEVLKYEASGKLLLFGEYFVLRGSKCLAIPLNVGQAVTITQHTNQHIFWQCFDEQNNCWLTIEFSTALEIVQTNDLEKAKIVQQLLQYIKQKNKNILLEQLNFQFTLSFNRAFGFGTSATLISLLSQWSGVNAYDLLANTFEGSGYDIATATASKPIVYIIQQKTITTFTLAKNITPYILFIYLGKKQISSKEINAFKNKIITPQQLEQMNNIVLSATNCTEIEAWENLMQQSETLVASVLNTLPIKEQMFQDYPFAIKSLGAWGGDFIMATCRDINTAKNYFLQKNMTTFFTYNELIK